MHTRQQGRWMALRQRMKKVGGQSQGVNNPTSHFCGHQVPVCLGPNDLTPLSSLRDHVLSVGWNHYRKIYSKDNVPIKGRGGQHCPLTGTWDFLRQRFNLLTHHDRIKLFQILWYWEEFCLENAEGGQLRAISHIPLMFTGHREGGGVPKVCSLPSQRNHKTASTERLRQFGAGTMSSWGKPECAPVVLE